MPTPDFSSVAYQGPLNAGGLMGPNSQRVVGRIHFSGSGMVGTAYGFPNFSATLVGTGIVDVRTPVSAMWSVNPVISTATGQHGFDARMERGVGTSVDRTYAPSGIARLVMLAPAIGMGGSGTYQASGSRRPANPPSGTVVDLQFDVFPTPQNGLVEF
jgi:hypothetical protein